MNYNLSEQALAFNEVLPWAGQIPAWEVQEDGKVVIKIMAPQAESVTVWRMKMVYGKEHFLIERDTIMFK